MRWWKLLGLAGLVGVAATGVVVTRAQRQRAAYTPEQVRSRLHERLAEAESRATPSAGSEVRRRGEVAGDG